MLIVNAVRGVALFGPTALNASRFELGILMLVLVPAWIRDEWQQQAMLRTIAVATAINIGAELALEFSIVPREIIRSSELPDIVPLYDTSVMIASFVVLGIWARYLMGFRQDIGTYTIGSCLLLVILMSLVRAVWLGMTVGALSLLFVIKERRRLSQYVSTVVLTVLVSLVIILNYQAIFGSRGDNYVVEGKSRTVFSVSEDQDLLFRVLTAVAAWEELTDSMESFLFGMPHGASVVYFDERGRGGEVSLHMAYLSTMQNAGIIGLLAHIFLQWQVVVLGIRTAQGTKGTSSWLSYTSIGCLVAMYAKMFFDYNGDHRQYIFFLFFGLIIALHRNSQKRTEAAESPGIS
jgi:hypothetical protein